MMEHDCKHEVDLALMSQKIDQILINQTATDARQDVVNKMIFGNGASGIKTQIARNSDAIKRMWWAVSIVFVGIIGLAVRSIIQ